MTPDEPKTEQPAFTGAGPLTERRYYVDVLRPQHPAEAVFQHIKCHIDEFSPDLLADFEKTKGDQGGLAVGHEFSIKILGPWNGCVRVTEVDEQHFQLATLEGHPEAGRITFSVRPLPVEGGGFRFEIHSWARSRDGMVALAYSALGLGKRVQEETWVTFCQRVLAFSGGESAGPVHVETVEYEGDTLTADQHARTC